MPSYNIKLSDTQVYTALFDYNKQEDNELDFKKGDKLVVVEKDEQV
jgi:hypothetical protein